VALPDVAYNQKWKENDINERPKVVYHPRTKKFVMWFHYDSGGYGDSLAGWKTMGGQWQIIDGELRQTTNETNARALVGDPGWSDYTLTLKARKLGGNEGFTITSGSLGDSTKSWWNLGGWDNTQHGLEAPGIPLTQVPGKIETGCWYDICVEVQGPTVKCYLDGKLVQQGTRSAG
jgi:hypothetical protein